MFLASKLPHILNLIRCAQPARSIGGLVLDLGLSLVLCLAFSTSALLSFSVNAQQAQQESYAESQAAPENSNVSPAASDQNNEQTSEQKSTDTEGKTASASDADKEQNPEQQKKSQKSQRPSVNPPKPIEDWHSADLSYYEKAEELIPMLSGTEDFITLQQPQQTSNPKGVVILVPDWQQHIANPKAMVQLRREFPANGWRLIGVQPPNKPRDFPRISGLPEDNIANEADLTSYQTALAQRINTVLTDAQNFPGVILVIAEGVNASLLAQIFNDEANQKPSALVSLSAYSVLMEKSQDYAEALSETEFPVLDLYLDKDNRWVLHDSKARKLAAEKNLKALFRQRMIFGQNHHYPTPELSRQIFNWLASVGW